MNAPKKPAPPLPPKTDQELIALLASPAGSTPAALAAAKAELRRRMQDYDSPSPGNPPRGTVRPQLSSMAVYSLVLCLLPYLGLPLAIGALRRIARSEGRLYGRPLAWASVVVNVLCLGFLLGSFILGLRAELPGR
jgi:hypothetical protein